VATASPQGKSLKLPMAPMMVVVVVVMKKKKI